MYQFKPTLLVHRNNDYNIEYLHSFVDRNIGAPIDEYFWEKEINFFEMQIIYLLNDDKLLSTKNKKEKLIDGAEAENPFYLYDVQYKINRPHDIRLLLSYLLSEESNIEPYGKNKQIKIIKTIIYNKLINLENRSFFIGYNDLRGHQGYYEHIELFGALSELENDGYIEIKRGVQYVNIVDDNQKHLFYRFDKAPIEVKNKLFKEVNSKSTKEKSIKTDATNKNILYEITHSKREIRINDKYLSKPNFYSENDNVFDYLFNHPNKICKIKDIEEEIGEKIKKPVGQIVRDLGFKGGLKDLFFPDISQKAIRFVNPVTKKYLIDNKINPLENIDSLIKKSRKK